MNKCVECGTPIDKRATRCVKHKHAGREPAERYYKKYQRDWLAFFKDTYGECPQCQICGTKLSWEIGSRNKVQFDHKNGYTGDRGVSYQPSNFYQSHPCIDQFKKEWLSFDFGRLCSTCNAGLPTNNREEWIQNLMAYQQNESPLESVTIIGVDYKVIWVDSPILDEGKEHWAMIDQACRTITIFSGLAENDCKHFLTHEVSHEIFNTLGIEIEESLIKLLIRMLHDTIIRNNIYTRKVKP